jgi:VWFA-related protein
VTFFAANAAPLDLVLLIDTSSSMFGRMALAQDAAIDLIRTLKPGDRGAVVLFSHTIRIAHPLTGDFPRLESAIRGAVPSGATAVYEALYVTLRDLARSRAEPGEPRRQAVVVLSDGEDNRSHVEFGDLLDEAKRMTTTIFTILPGPFPDPDLVDPTRAKPNALFEMRTLAEETGGRAFAPATMADLGRIYREIASELSQQYLLAYAPQPTPVDGFRRIAVRAETHPDLRVRTRSGYAAKRVAAR